MHATKQIQRRNAVRTKNRINGWYQDDADFEYAEYNRMQDRLIDVWYEKRDSTYNICSKIASVLIKKRIEKYGEERVQEDYIWWDYFSDYGTENYYYQYQAEGVLARLEKKGHTRTDIYKMIDANTI